MFFSFLREQLLISHPGLGIFGTPSGEPRNSEQQLKGEANRLTSLRFFPCTHHSLSFLYYTH